MFFQMIVAKRLAYSMYVQHHHDILPLLSASKPDPPPHVEVAGRDCSPFQIR